MVVELGQILFGACSPLFMELYRQFAGNKVAQEIIGGQLSSFERHNNIEIDSPK